MIVSSPNALLCNPRSRVNNRSVCSRAWAPTRKSATIRCVPSAEDSTRRDHKEESPTSMDRDDPTYAGQSDYSRTLLMVYDRVVLGLVSWFVWRCSTSELVDRYRQHSRDRHLDVGPGTGYFIERSGLPDRSRVTILDPKPERPRSHVPAASAHGRHGRRGRCPQAAPSRWPVRFGRAPSGDPLPGPRSRKALAVANVAAVLAPTGVLFGASVLGTSGSHSWLARRVLRAFNRRGAFDNLDDSEEGLREMLEASFERVELETLGSVAIFAAKNPRTATSR